jgi:DNA-binding LytR/AlgR family response regulator
VINRSPINLLAGDRRLLAPATIVGAWTLVAMAAVLQAIALVRLDGRADLAGAVLGRLSIIPVWAIATPFILRSARWFPVVTAKHRVELAAIAAHMLLGSLFIVLANVAIRIPIAFADGGLEALTRSTMQGVAEFYPPAMVVYGVIVAIGHFVLRPPIADSPATRLVSPPVRSELSEAAVAPTMEPHAETPASATATVAAMDGHITVRQWNRVHLVRVEDIDFVEAEDNYVVVHAASRSYKGRDRIRNVESQLDAHRFVRIHRSTIVHIAKIREVQPLTHGDHAVILRDGKVLRVARSRRQALEQALGVEL